MFIGIGITLTGAWPGSIVHGMTVPADAFMWEDNEPMQNEDDSYEQAG